MELWNRSKQWFSKWTAWSRLEHLPALRRRRRAEEDVLVVVVGRFLPPLALAALHLGGRRLLAVGRLVLVAVDGAAVVASETF